MRPGSPDRTVGGRIGLAVEGLQVIRAVEVRQRDRGEVDVLPVGERADHKAAVVDRNRLELASGKAVLRDLADGRMPAGTAIASARRRRN